MRRGLLVTLGLLGAMVFAQNALAGPAIGVAEFRNQTRAHWWRTGVGWELSGMLANELVSTGKFNVVERSKLEHVLREQDLGASGRVRHATAAKIGQLTGAKYLVMGTVTAFEHNTSSTGGGIGIGGFRIGGKKEEAYMAVDLRVVNTDTGELEYVRSVEARSTDTGMSFGVHRGGFSGALSQEKNTPVGKAIRAMVIEASDYLACAMVDQGSCMAEYDAKERRRRERTKDSINLD